MARTSTRPELQPFIELNEKEKREGKKTPWKERYALIKTHFPIVAQIDWRKAFIADDDLYGRVWRDILRVDQANEVNAGQGPRPALDPQRARERLRQLMGNDYSHLPFDEAFSVLAGDRSIRNLARKIGMSVSATWNLKNGHKEPDLYDLELIAKSFGKEPSYFLEYRMAYIIGAMADQMMLAPEMTVDMYRELRNIGKLGG